MRFPTWQALEDANESQPEAGVVHFRHQPVFILKFVSSVDNSFRLSDWKVW